MTTEHRMKNGGTRYFTHEESEELHRAFKEIERLYAKIGLQVDIIVRREIPVRDSEPV